MNKKSEQAYNANLEKTRELAKSLTSWDLCNIYHKELDRRLSCLLNKQNTKEGLTLNDILICKFNSARTYNGKYLGYDFDEFNPRQLTSKVALTTEFYCDSDGFVCVRLDKPSTLKIINLITDEEKREDFLNDYKTCDLDNEDINEREF